MTSPEETTAAAGDATALLALLPVPAAPGLSAAELAEVQRRYGIRFAADHRALLSAGLPVGDGFPDWRHGNAGELRDLLRRPVEGVLFDVRENAFWYPGWGERPAAVPAAVRLAGSRLVEAPPLVPIYRHRYLPGVGGPSGHPVLSVSQTDIIVYGADLPRYLRAEFGGGYRPELVEGARATVPFWSELLG